MNDYLYDIDNGKYQKTLQINQHIRRNTTKIELSVQNKKMIVIRHLKSRFMQLLLGILFCMYCGCSQPNNLRQVYLNVKDSVDLAVFYRFKLYDTVMIEMPVSVNSNLDSNAIILPPSEPDWKYDPNKDLRTTCFIIGKTSNEDSSTLGFTLLMLKTDKPWVPILGNHVRPGDVFGFSISNARIFEYDKSLTE